MKIVVASPLAFWLGCSLSYRACSRKILALSVVPAPLYAYGLSPVARLYLAKNETPEEEAAVVPFSLLVDQPQESFICKVSSHSMFSMHLQISRQVTVTRTSSCPKLNSIQLSLRHCNCHKCCLKFMFCPPQLYPAQFM